MQYILCSATGYLIGCINPAYLMAKLYGYKDIRKEGSGNAGASNIGFLLGRKMGIFVALLDIFKAVIAISLAKVMFYRLAYSKVIAGSFAVIGHMFPFNMGFRGGKGLASFGGFVLAINVWLFFIMCIVFAAVILITDYLVFGMLSAVIIFPLFMAFTVDITSGLIISCVSVLMIIKHRINFQRSGKGLEYKISFLWNVEAKNEFKDKYLAYYGMNPEDGSK